MSAHNNPFLATDAPLLCYVTDRRALPDVNPDNPLAPLLRKIEQLAAAVDLVQIREKDLCAAELAHLTRQSLRIAANQPPHPSGPMRVLVNDRLDVAIAQRAHGVHLGEKSLPVAEARQLVASAQQRQTLYSSFLIGASCHSLAAGQAAQRDGADYLFFGPIFPTPSKERFGPPQGLDRLTQVCRSVTIPVLAIGGITSQNAPSCIAAGAAGIAAIRLFQDALDPERTVASIRASSRP